MVELDPDKREWEYDATGTKIYKLESGKPVKTPYTELDGGVPIPGKVIKYERSITQSS